MSFEIRNISINDYHKNYFELLQQLTDSPKISFEMFQEIVGKIKENIYVMEDIEAQKIIASGTLFIEQKLIRNGGKVGHMEDIVVDKNYRNQKLGKKIVSFLIEEAKKRNCYKIIGDCSDYVLSFYNQLGFEKKANQIAIYF